MEMGVRRIVSYPDDDQPEWKEKKTFIFFSVKLYLSYRYAYILISMFLGAF